MDGMHLLVYFIRKHNYTTKYRVYNSFMYFASVVVYWFQKPKGGISMEKFIPYEKLSKKEKRKIDRARRQTWGELNPVTRKPENSKAYNRKKSQDWKRELPPKTCDFSYFIA